MTIPFANIFQPLIDVFEAVLIFFHDKVGLGWGFSIIAMTVVVRALMIPLTLKQFRSMQGMQRLQPQIKELQAKYKDDRQRLNQEMMKFYQENKVNPFGSCLPLLLQMPVFLSLFYMLRKDLRHDICPAINPAGVANPKPCGATDAASFLGIPDLTSPAAGKVLVILLVLYVGSQLLSSLLMSVTVDKNQRLLMLGLPFIFVLFVQNFPAGLLVYWITTNLWTVGQQYLVRRTVGPITPLPGVNEAKVGAVTGGAGGVAAALGSGDGNGGGNGKGSGGIFGALAARAAAAAEDKPEKKKPEPAAAGATAARDRPVRPAGPPPQSPRKKKKRSGRRR